MAKRKAERIRPFNAKIPRYGTQVHKILAEIFLVTHVFVKEAGQQCYRMVIFNKCNILTNKLQITLNPFKLGPF